MSENAVETIREWGWRMRDLAGSGPQIAECVGEICEREIIKAASEDRSPDGVGWEPRQLMGRRGRIRRDAAAAGKLLKNVADHISVRVIGKIIVITLTGHYVFHHFGAGNPRRGILPMGGVDKLGNAIRRGIVDMGEEFMGRKGRHDRGSGGTKWRPTAGASS